MKPRVELKVDGLAETEALMERLREKLAEAEAVMQDLEMASHRMGLLVKIEQPPAEPAAEREARERIGRLMDGNWPEDMEIEISYEETDPESAQTLKPDGCR